MKKILSALIAASFALGLMLTFSTTAYAYRGTHVHHGHHRNVGHHYHHRDHRYYAPYHRTHTGYHNGRHHGRVRR